MPGIVASLLPTADDIEAFIHLRQKIGDLRRVVLKVGIQGDNQVTACRLEAGIQSRGFFIFGAVMTVAFIAVIAAMAPA